MKTFLAIAGLMFGSAISVSTPAHADYPDAYSYADEQCGNGGYQLKGYPSYSSCYSAAIAYYYQQTGGGGDGYGGGGPGGGGGGTFIGDVPGYTGGEGCASRFCDDGS